jgi:hypothetical protein
MEIPAGGDDESSELAGAGEDTLSQLQRYIPAVQCSAVQCSAVQYSAVQCSAVQCSAVQCSAVQCSAVHLSSWRETFLPAPASLRVPLFTPESEAQE